MVSFGFENPLGWLAFLSLIPLLILYIIRPKPQQVEVPSLMFFSKHIKTESKTSFFKRFTKDWLFIIQLLIILLLSMFFVDPYLKLKGDFFTDNAVIVLDTSGSTTVFDNQVFTRLISEAKKVVGKQNTLILVASTPRVILENGNKREALAVLNRLKPAATTSNIGEALLFAGQYTQGDQPHIYLISDLLNTGGVDITTATKALESRGIAVTYIPVSPQKEVNNVGITKVKITDEGIDVFVKNYMNKEASTDVALGSEKKILIIQPGETQLAHFQPISKTGTITLSASDDFPIDNTAYLSMPKEKDITVLLISNTPSVYLKAALTATESVVFDLAQPPIISNEPYDLYIIHDIKPERLIAGSFSTITQHVKEGANLIIHAQKDSKDISYGELLHLTLTEKKGFSPVTIAQENQITKDVEFGGVKQYFATKNDKGIPLATADESSVISLSQYGEGKILYYGILEEASDFILSPSYPVFWDQAITFLGGIKTLADLNKQGGETLFFSKRTDITTPSEKMSVTGLTLTEPGFYTVNGDTIAVSLVSEEESNFAVNREERKNILTQIEDLSSDKIKKPFAQTLIIITLIFLLIEIIWIKGRGDI